MSGKNFFKRWYIRMRRYLFGQEYMTVMDGLLKGYQWSTASSYEYILGNYEDAVVMETFMSWLEPDSVVYDLGGNVGYYALVANRTITTGKIYSFEPMPAARDIFKTHIELNREFIKNDNIYLLPMIISDQEKLVEFSNDAEQRDGNTYIRSSRVFSGAGETIKVQSHTIDGLVKEGYDKPDIIKIDVEGAEYDVLCGAIDTLKEHKPNVLLATHDWHLPGVKDKCVNFLQELGYSLTYTGTYNKQLKGLDDYIAVHESKL